MARILKRLSGPVLVLIALGLVKLQQRPITEATGVEFATGPASYAFASAGYFALAWFGGRLVSVALESTSKRQRRVPKLLQEIIAAAFFLVALVATGALFLGRSGAGALASSGLVIAILGFAIRNVLADVLSGIALGLEAPFRIGDWVEFDSSLRGKIIEIGWRTTRILTRDSTYMILPNSQIARQQLTNYSAPKSHYRAQVTLTLGHDLDPEEMKALIVEAVSRVQGILHEPAADARVLAHDLGGVTYTLRYWVPSFAEDVDCRDKVLEAVILEMRQHAVPGPYKALRVDISGPDGVKRAAGES